MGKPITPRPRNASLRFLLGAIVDLRPCNAIRGSSGLHEWPRALAPAPYLRDGGGWRRTLRALTPHRRRLRSTLKISATSAATRPRDRYPELRRDARLAQQFRARRGMALLFAPGSPQDRWPLQSLRLLPRACDLYRLRCRRRSRRS